MGMLGLAQKVVDAAWQATHKPRSGVSMGTPAGYDSASTDRRLAAWTGGLGWDAASLVTSDAPMVRRRCRDLVRNNAWASAAADGFEGNLVGLGIKPWWSRLPLDVRQPLRMLWDEWVNEVDPGGCNNLYGLQGLLARHWFSDGEAFVRMRVRRASDGLSVPLQLQLYEADQLDLQYNDANDKRRQIKNGIEFDQLGRRVAYHFWRDHPGDMLGMGLGSQEYVRVRGDEVLHFFHPMWTSMLRGMPILTPAAIALQEMQGYNEAELLRKRLAASFVGFIRRDITMDDSSDPQAVDKFGNPIPDTTNMTLAPGTFPYLAPGEDIAFAELPDSGDYDRYVPVQLRGIASATRNTYENMTGDMSRTTFSSARVSFIYYGRLLAMGQYHRLVHQVMRPLINRWLDLVALEQKVPMPGYYDDPRPYRAVMWTPHGFDYVDPQKQIKAAKEAIGAGLDSRTSVILKRGGNPDEVDAQRVQDREREEALGLQAPAGSGQALEGPPDEPSDDPAEPDDGAIPFRRGRAA